MASKADKKASFRQLEFEFPAPSEDAPANPMREVSGAPAALDSSAAPPGLTSAAPLHDQDYAGRLHAELCAATGVAIQLRVTNNSSTMMSLRYNAAGTVAHVGLHHMFLDAPAEVRQALSAWILKPRAKAPGKQLEAFIAAQRHLIKRRPARRTLLRTQGEFFDLEALYREVNAEYFEGTVTAPITWGKMPAQRRRRSIRFGSFSPGENLIRIHPLLDQDFVPRFFVRYIVFHEMLHAHMGIEESPSGRRRIHPPEFRRREAAYPDFGRACRWMDDGRNLRRLLHSPGA